MILDRVRAAGWRVFDDPRGRDLNLIAVRHGRSTPGAGDDWLYAAWRERGETAWTLRAWRCETEPGIAYLRNPVNPRGTAVIAPGQYRGAYRRGLHKGRPALVQTGPVTVYRDNDRDTRIELDESSRHPGLHAVNIHDVPAWGALAGCIGLEPAAMRELLAIYDASAVIYGPRVTLTLLEG